MPVSQPFGSRPSMRMVTSVPASDVTRTSLAPRSRAATRSAIGRICSKSAVIAPCVQASTWCGALKHPRVPPSWARPFASVWYSDRDSEQSVTVEAAIAAATTSGGSSPLDRRGAIVMRVVSQPISRATASSDVEDGGVGVVVAHQQEAVVGGDAQISFHHVPGDLLQWRVCVSHSAISYQIHGTRRSFRRRSRPPRRLSGDRVELPAAPPPRRALRRGMVRLV